MKKVLITMAVAVFLFVVSFSNARATMWINEFHYDNAGTDTNEFIEVFVTTNFTGSLSNITVTLYNGASGASYNSFTLDKLTVGNTITAGTFYFTNLPSGGLQNGDPDGIALSESGTVVQFLSYDGAFTATNGTAAGIPSFQIGAAELGTADPTSSISLIGNGSEFGNFTWTNYAMGSQTPGAENVGQTINGGVPSVNTVTIANTIDTFESGTNGILTLTAVGGQFPIIVPYTLSGTATVLTDYTNTPAVILMTNTTATITIQPVDDGMGDPNETVVVTLNPSGFGWTAGVADSATNTILETVLPPSGSTNIVTIVAAANGSEQGTNGVFTVVSTGTNFPITVTYTVGGTATLTNDYDFLAPATSNSIVMLTATTNIDIVPVNDGDTNEINPEDVIITLDANGPGWEAGSPNIATVQIYETVITNQPQPPSTNVTVFFLSGFTNIVQKPKLGKVIKFKSAKGLSPSERGPKGRIATSSNVVNSVAYAIVIDSGTNVSTNAPTFVPAGVLKQVTKGKLFKKQSVKAQYKATKTSKLGIGTPVGTTSAKIIVRVGGTSGTNAGFQFFTNTYTVEVK